MSQAPSTATEAITLECAGNCGATDRVPSKLVNTAKSGQPAVFKAVPVQTFPYICQDCWLKGCRCVGGKIEWVKT